MTEKETERIDRVYALTVFGKTVRQYQSREAALAGKADLMEAPNLFIEIEEWEPEGWMWPYVHFREDEVKDG